MSGRCHENTSNKTTLLANKQEDETADAAQDESTHEGQSRRLQKELDLHVTSVNAFSQ